MVQWAANQTADYILDNMAGKDISELGNIVEKSRKEFRSVSKSAMAIGSNVHAAIEYLLKTGKEPVISADAELAGYMAFLEWADQHDFLAIETEHTVYSERYAGTCDLICTLNGKKYLIDFKTSTMREGTAAYPEHRYQVAAYRQTDPTIEGTGVLYLNKQDGYPQWRDVSGTYEKDVAVFNCLVELWYLIHSTKSEGNPGRGKMNNLPAVIEKDVFAIMDKLDDEIIQAELENRVVSTWVYSFPGQDGKAQTGLSKRGVDEACTEMAKKGHIIEELSIEYSQCPVSKEHVLFKALVRRVLVNKDGSRVPLESVFGTKRQWIKDTRKNGPAVDDKFWYEKGAAKALRNARSRLIPAEIQATIISLAKKSGKVKNIETESKPAPSFHNHLKAPEPPPEPAKDEATTKQRGMLFAKCKEKWGDDRDKAKQFADYLLSMAGVEHFTKAYISECIDDFEQRAADFEAV